MSDHVVTIRERPELTIVAPQIQSVASSYAYPILIENDATGSQRVGDETWQLVNVWQSIYDAMDSSTLARRLVDFYTLNVNNIFGNTNRFTLSDGSEPLQTWGQEVYDHYQGVILYQPDPNAGNQTWEEQIDAAMAYGDGWYLAPWHMVTAVMELRFGGDIGNQYFNWGFQAHTSSTRVIGGGGFSIVYAYSSGQVILGTTTFSNTRKSGFYYKLI